MKIKHLIVLIFTVVTISACRTDDSLTEPDIIETWQLKTISGGFSDYTYQSNEVIWQFYPQTNQLLIINNTSHGVPMESGTYTYLLQTPTYPSYTHDLYLNGTWHSYLKINGNTITMDYGNIASCGPEFTFEKILDE